MSDTSLNTSLYEEIREYAEMVDQLLIGLKDGTSSEKDDNRRKMGNLLLQLAENRYEDLSSRLIMLVIRDSGNIRQSDYRKMGKALLSTDIDDSVVNWLEMFAQSLEKGQADALSRVRGWSH